jgi:predicted DNA-binding transcriptional regulator YafY
LWNLRFLNARQTGSMLETSVRLLRLLSLLQARPLWSGAELADRLEVTTRTVRLHAPAGMLAEQLTPAAGLLQPDGEHACILETGSDSLYGLVAFLSSLEVAFTVIEPPELRDLLRTLAGRYQAAAREPGA